MLNAMNVNVVDTTNSSLCEDEGEKRNSGFSLTLHSNYTVLKRMVHMSCILSILYAVGFASVQFTTLNKLRAAQHSALGLSDNRYTIAKAQVEFLAAQWSAPSFQDPVEQEALINLWFGLDAVKFLAVYSDEGHLISLAPEGGNLSSVVRSSATSYTVSASFHSNEQSGRIIMVVDDEPFNNLEHQRTALLFKGLLACVFISGVIGAYLFRSFRYFRPKRLT